MKTINLGLISYQDAYSKQLHIVEDVKNGAEETLIICSHPPVVTLGKKADPEEIRFWKGEVVQIERGGRSTYHGPNQVIIYPVVDLARHGQNLSGYLEVLENSMIVVLNSLGLKATGNPDRGNPDLTGIWINGLKIASIGIAVKRWVTYHGLALNLDHDPHAFQGINPCGKDASIMTSLEALLGKKVDRSTFEKTLSEELVMNLEKLK
ncbi:MAG: lipoyl(octanoyl) transferase LipB [Bdellovibrio sp.]